LEAIRQVMTVDNTVFGQCPRSTCRGTGLLPYGYSNDYTTSNAATTTTSTNSIPTTTTKVQYHRSSASGSSSSPTAATTTTTTTHVKSSCCHRYCPSCGEVWIAWDSKTDGCAWGPSWCHLFLLAFGIQVYAKELADATAATSASSIRRVVPSSLSSSYNTDTSSSSRPIPSIFGFRIHPATSFGRPLNEQSSLF